MHPLMSSSKVQTLAALTNHQESVVSSQQSTAQASIPISHEPASTLEVVRIAKTADEESFGADAISTTKGRAYAPLHILSLEPNSPSFPTGALLLTVWNTKRPGMPAASNTVSALTLILIRLSGQVIISSLRATELIRHPLQLHPYHRILPTRLPPLELGLVSWPAQPPQLRPSRLAVCAPIKQPFGGSRLELPDRRRSRESGA